MNIDFKTYHQFDNKFDGKKKCQHECYSSGTCPFNISEEKIPCAEEYPYADLHYKFTEAKQYEIWYYMFTGAFLMKVNDNEAISLPSNKRITITEPGEYRIRYYTSATTIAPTWSFRGDRKISSIDITKLQIDEMPRLAFSNNQSLSKLIGFDKVKIFREGALRDCKLLNMQSLSLLNAERIETYAFYDTPSLKTFVIGPNCTFLGSVSFGGNISGRMFTFKGKTPPTMDGDAFYINQNPIIYVPAESLNLYKTATGWTKWASRIFPMAT